MNDDPPPTQEQWERLPEHSRWMIFLLVMCSCCIPRRPALPRPVHFAVLATLCSFVLMAFMPHHPMAIPTIIGGGLAGALLMMGG